MFSSLPRKEPLFRSKRDIEGLVMAQDVSMIGIHADEVGWMRLLVSLLRHPDPNVPELARQALVYVLNTAGTRTGAPPDERASAVGA